MDRGKKNGSILIIALWTLCFLTVLALSLGYSARQKVTFSKRIDERLKLRAVAEVGVERGINFIKNLFDQEVLSLKQYTFRNDQGLFKHIIIGDASVDLLYTIIDESKREYKEMFGFCDEESKVNINLTDLRVMTRLFQYLLDCDVIEAQELAASIIDWRDNDSMLSLPLGSAESSYYRNLPYPYESKDDSFESLDELLLVKGINKETFAKLRNYITIYGSGTININTATKPVLLALGLAENIVNKLLLLRNGKDSIPFTSDDFVFTQIQEVAARLSQTYNLSSGEVAAVNNVVNQYMGVASHYFTLLARSKLNYSAATFDVMCVVNDKGAIVYWQE